MLGTFQNELVALVLSAFASEQQLHTRHELSHCLYQRDTACHIIKRLKKEVDRASTILENLAMEAPLPASTSSTASSSSAVRGKRVAEDDELHPYSKKFRPGLSAAIIAELKECSAALSEQRKRRQISSSLAPVDAVARYTQLHSHTLHKRNLPGILSIDIHQSISKDMIVTGGVDGNAVVFNPTTGEILSTLSGHSLRVNSVKFVADGEFVVTASDDKTVRVWQAYGNYGCRHVFKDHLHHVRAVTVHATNNYFVTASRDSTWCFYDLFSGQCLSQVSDPTTAYGFSCAAFHPDGEILGTGTCGPLVKLWDIKSQTNIGDFDGHMAGVSAISFSENGYFVATASHNGAKLWDLRKLMNFKNLGPFNDYTPTLSVEFDHSGSYLALGGSDVRVYQVAKTKSEWNSIKTIPDSSGTGIINCVKFGPDANYIAVGSMDGNLRRFGLPEAVES